MGFNTTDITREFLCAHICERLWQNKEREGNKKKKTTKILTVETPVTMQKKVTMFMTKISIAKVN